jgi:chromosome segregation ATPase
MGRESAITYEQVVAAADAMKAGGLRPTSRAIRERLGNTGSMGTINRMLGEWKVGQEHAITSALVLPSGIQRAILEFMGQELSAAKAALEADLAEQHQEVADLATENERQASEIDGHIAAVTALQVELAMLQGRATQVDLDCHAAQAEAERERQAAESARTELAKAMLRLESMPRLEADLGTVRAALESEQRARVAAEQSAAVLAAQLVGCNDRGAELQNREAKGLAHAAELEHQLQAATADAGKARAAAQTVEQQAAVLAAKLEASDQRGAEIEAREQAAIARCGELERQIQGLTREVGTANVAVQASQARLESAARELDGAREQMRTAREDSKRAGEEAAELRGQLDARGKDKQ